MFHSETTTMDMKTPLVAIMAAIIYASGRTNQFGEQCGSESAVACANQLLEEVLIQAAAKEKEKEGDENES